MIKTTRELFVVVFRHNPHQMYGEDVHSSRESAECVAVGLDRVQVKKSGVKNMEAVSLASHLQAVKDRVQKERDEAFGDGYQQGLAPHGSESSVLMKYVGKGVSFETELMDSKKECCALLLAEFNRRRRANVKGIALRYHEMKRWTDGVWRVEEVKGHK